jgi:hypothetical protein
MMNISSSWSQTCLVCIFFLQKFWVIEVLFVAILPSFYLADLTWASLFATCRERVYVVSATRAGYHERRRLIPSDCSPSFSSEPVRLQCEASAAGKILQDLDSGIFLFLFSQNFLHTRNIFMRGQPISLFISFRFGNFWDWIGRNL